MAEYSRWTAQQAWNWYKDEPWLCGFNYVTSTAINSTEMWQSDTFDEETIDKELGWAERVGFNTCRVFLQYVVWQNDREEFLNRIDRFLKIAFSHHISTMLILFDDCAFSGKQPYIGKQEEPTPGVHNSGWVPSPGHQRVVDQTTWPQLQEYVTAVVTRFAEDVRVVAWDVYNEPGNSDMRDKSLPLLRESFAWARACQPSQPLTAGVWHDNLVNLNQASLDLSDVISFHLYASDESLEKKIAELKKEGRPVLCTEWFSRVLESHLASQLPIFQRESVGSYFWGLVNGKTQTHFPWGSVEGAPEPEVWHHDLLHSDGRFYREEERELLQQYLR